ncbi:MAG: trypsin-like peptidase domain-containing protein [Planctomycetota bacterium]|nr:trypsin-like peptidase domain-containing protein [Planctomycetota bacterium]
MFDRLTFLKICLLGCLSFVGHAVARGDEPPPPPRPPAPVEPEQTVEQLTESAKKSIVVISFTGRDGRNSGLGTGFVISADGLIATNLHVIGEGRPLNVQTSDGRNFEVKSIEAFDRHVDLALIRVDATDLPALPLGDSDAIRQGQSVIVLGNPRGLKYSVVAGVISGVQEIDRKTMLQLAIPIEPGNSGGPVLDRQGRVLGVVTMKSLVTDNLGFAMPVHELKNLQEKPNPTLMSRWLTIGALDPQEWTALMGGRWKQRAGRILAEGAGNGFGGRTVCLSTAPVPDAPFEIAVSVKLDNEEGAAGLAFCSDGGDKHYGFYPSGGKLRLTCFMGPDVNSWPVLADVRSEHYRPGEWNHLKVRFQPKKIECFVNGKLVIESTDERLTAGRVGLAKFRNTIAEFKGFRVGKELPSDSPAPELLARLNELTAEIGARPSGGRELASRLGEQAKGSQPALRERARELDRQAAQLRQAAQVVHEQAVIEQLVGLFSRPEEEIELFRAALLVAQLDNEEVDVESYLGELDRMVRETSKDLPADATDPVRLAALNKYLFSECGFHGTRGDHYDHRSNSYVNEVLDDREGLPITLSVIYIEMARKIGVKVVGVGLPSHFVVRHEPTEGPSQLIDVYERAANLSREEADALVKANLGRPLQSSDLESTTKRTMIIRMLTNLRGLAERQRDHESHIRYLDAIIALDPDAADPRVRRAIVRFMLGRRDDALADANWLLDKKPDGINLNQVEDLRQAILRGDR